MTETSGYMEEIHECIACRGRFDSAETLANHTCPIATPFISLDPEPGRAALSPFSTEILREALQLPVDVQILGNPDGNILLPLVSPRVPEGAEYVLASWTKQGDQVEFRQLEAIPAPAYAPKRYEEIAPEAGGVETKLGNPYGSGDAAIAIGYDAFKAGWAAHAAMISLAASGDRSSLPEAVTSVEQAWAQYVPPEDIKALI